MINHEYKFIFVHINKTGGTSIERVFCANDAELDIPEKHATIRRFSKLHPKEFQSYFKFSFVRNPFDWLVSRYFWSKDLIFKCYSKVTGPQIDYSFEEFIDRVANDRPWCEPAAWSLTAVRPQLDRLTIDGKLAVDFVGKYEQLQTDFDKICEQCQIPKVILPHYFKTKREHYSSYYTGELIEKVVAKYACDFDTFGYDKTPQSK
jgi:hypothetical protein